MSPLTNKTACKGVANMQHIAAHQVKLPKLCQLRLIKDEIRTSIEKGLIK